MNYKISATPRFAKELKKLTKRYRSLKVDLTLLQESIRDNPIRGIALGNNCYKIRLAISDKRKGKRGGARVITHVKVIETTVFLLSIYDKSEQNTVSESRLEELLGQIEEE